MGTLVEQAVVGQGELEVRADQAAIQRARTGQRGMAAGQGLQEDADEIDRVLVQFAETGLRGVVAKLARAADDLVADHRGQRAMVVAGDRTHVRRRVVALQHRRDAEQLLRAQHAHADHRRGRRRHGAGAQHGLAPGAQLLVDGFAVAQRAAAAVAQHAAAGRRSVGLAGHRRALHGHALHRCALHRPALHGLAGHVRHLLAVAPAGGVLARLAGLTIAGRRLAVTGLRLAIALRHLALAGILGLLRARLDQTTIRRPAGLRRLRLRLRRLHVLRLIARREAGIQGVVDLGVQLDQRLREALLELEEDQPAQFGREVVFGEELDEGRHRHFGTQRVHLGRLPRQAQRGGQRVEALVHHLQRVHQLVFQQFDDLLAGQVRFELRLGHQAHALVLDRARARIAPGVERRFEGFAVAVGQLQRALVEQADGETVVVDRAAVVAGDRGEADLLLDVSPEPCEHARQRRHRVAAKRFVDLVGTLARRGGGAARVVPAVVVHGVVSGEFGGE